MTKEQLAHEIIRLKELQKELREEIKEYKQQLIKEQGAGLFALSKEYKDKLVERFQWQLQRNSWLLKKIIFEIKRMD